MKQKVTWKFSRINGIMFSHVEQYVKKNKSFKQDTWTGAIIQQKKHPTSKFLVT